MGVADGRCGVDRERKVRRIRSVPRTERTDLIEQAIADQGAVLQRLHSVRPLPEWAGLSLTVSQLTALFVLYRHGSVSVGEFGRLVGLSKARVSLLVNVLMSHGLLERHQDPRDRRRAALRLSARAHALLSEHYTGSRQQFADWLAQLDAADLASLARGMRALAAVANAVEARAAGSRAHAAG
jgi:DNA-binding MarR family transcriptional regulator